MSMESLNICIVGAGRAGMIHARNFQNIITNSNVIAVADSFEKACIEACDELGINRYYTDYREVLKQDDIDAIIVASPTKYHREIVVEAAKAKKHVLCEKPMAMNINECKEMIKASQENKIKLMIGFMRRFDKSFIAAKEAIDSGEIGEIVHVRSLTRGPSKPQKWMYDIEKSSGPLAEVNSHDIDCVRWLVGSEIDHVYALAGNYRNKEVGEKWPTFYDNVVMSGQFTNGVALTIEGAQYVKYGYDARVEVLGTNGVLHIGKQNEHSFVTVNEEKGIHAQFVSSWTELFTQAYLSEDEHFVDCVLNDKIPRVTGFDGSMTVKVVEAGNLSIIEKRIIQL